MFSNEVLKSKLGLFLSNKVQFVDIHNLKTELFLLDLYTFLGHPAR